jgi:hypothetical protein
LSACEHEPWPAAGWYVPALQLEHTVATGWAWNVPALQLAHVDDALAPEAVENFPTPQESHCVSAVRPVPVWYLPPTHSRQLADETEAWLGLYVPAAHRTHALSPDPLWYCP